MNEERQFEALARRARLEEPPWVDVTARVMAALESGSAGEPLQERGLVWLASLSAAAAAIMLVGTTVLWNTWTDPLADAVFDLTRGLI